MKRVNLFARRGLAAALVAAGLAAASTAASAFELQILGNATFSPENPSPDIAAVYKAAWDEFVAANPDVAIKFDKSASSPDAVQEILTKVNTGRVVDMGIVETSWIARLNASGLLQPMDGILSDADVADFLPGVLEAQTKDGHLRGIQLYNSWRGVFYRPSEMKALGYEAPPTNWDDFLAFGEKALKAGYKSAVMFPALKSELTMLYMMPQFFGLGGELFDATGRPVFQDSPNREKLMQVMSMWRELVERGLMPKTVGAQNEADQRPFFYTRETATIGNATSFVNQYYIDQPDLKGDFGAVTMPMPAGHIAVPPVAGWAYVIFTSDPQRQDVARRFIKHLTQSKVMAKFNAVQGHLPVRHSIWKTEPYFAADPLMQKIYAIHLAAPMKIAGSSPMYPAAREAISGRMADVVAGILAPKDAVDQAGEEVMAAYKRLITR